MSPKFVRLLICAGCAGALFQAYSAVSEISAVLIQVPVQDLRTLLGTLAILWICWRISDLFLKDNGL